MGEKEKGQMGQMDVCERTDLTNSPYFPRGIYQKKMLSSFVCIRLDFITELHLNTKLKRAMHTPSMIYNMFDAEL